MPFIRAVLAMKARVVEPTARKKRLYISLYHQNEGDFQHKNCTVGSLVLHDSDHDGAVRLFVRHS